MTEKAPKLSWESLRHPFHSRYGPTAYVALGDEVSFTLIKKTETKLSTGLTHTDEVISRDIQGVVRDYTLRNNRSIGSITIRFMPTAVDWVAAFLGVGRDLKSKDFPSSAIGHLSVETPNPRIPITHIAQPDSM